MCSTCALNRFALSRWSPTYHKQLKIARIGPCGAELCEKTWTKLTGASQNVSRFLIWLYSFELWIFCLSIAVLLDSALVVGGLTSLHVKLKTGLNQHFSVSYEERCLLLVTWFQSIKQVLLVRFSKNICG